MDENFLLSMFFKIIMLIVVFILVLVGSQSIVRSIVKELNKFLVSKFFIIRSFSIKNENITEKSIKEFNKEVSDFFLVQEKQKELRLLTSIIGGIEFLIFIFLSIVVFSEIDFTILERFKILGVASSGWIALKIFGNYRQWSGIFLGRATFYIFLIGSLTNIIIAITLGKFLASVM